MITKQKLVETLAEVERFKTAAEEALKEHEAAMKRRAEIDEDGYYRYVADPLSGSAVSGAVRRASMDLTRSLAKLRKVH